MTYQHTRYSGPKISACNNTRKGGDMNDFLIATVSFCAGAYVEWLRSQRRNYKMALKLRKVNDMLRRTRKG